MKTVDGEGYCLRTLKRASREYCLRLATKAKKTREPQKATASHSEPLQRNREPLLEKKKRPTSVIWSLARAWTPPDLIVRGLKMWSAAQKKKKDQWAIEEAS